MPDNVTAKKKSPVHLLPKLIPDATLDRAELIRKTDNSSAYELGMLSEKEFTRIVIPERRAIIKGLIMEDSINIINGRRGGGKSWFVEIMANEVTWRGQVGPWKVEQGMNALIIDGEMPMSLLQERLAAMNRGRDINKKKSKLFLYPEAFAYRIGLKRSNLLDEEWRHEIYKNIMNLDVGFLVLDNLSSLAPGIDENDKTPFDIVNRWLLEMRFNRVTTVMTHHTGKSGEQRGTSAHEDHVDVSMVLKKPKGYKKEDGCRFTCEITKDRAFVTGEDTHTLTLSSDGERTEFIIDSEYEKELPIRRAVTKILEAHPDATHKEVVEKFGVSVGRKTFLQISANMNKKQKTVNLHPMDEEDEDD